MLESGALRSRAHQALARIGAPRAGPAQLPQRASRDAEVRRLAVEASVECGTDVGRVEARVPIAQGEDRKALEASSHGFPDAGAVAPVHVVVRASDDRRSGRAIPPATGPRDAAAHTRSSR